MKKTFGIISKEKIMAIKRLTLKRALRSKGIEYGENIKYEFGKLRQLARQNGIFIF